MQQLNVTIDNRKFTATAGQTILELAQDNGIEIPNLCHDPRLKPSGLCRLCLVDVEGQRGPVTACTFEVTDNMVVTTNSDRLHALRRRVLELLFSEHSGSCASCDYNGQCKLQEYAYDFQIDRDTIEVRPRTAEPNYTTGNEAIDYDPNKCIRCGRCVRICEEVQGDTALTFRERASQVEVSTAFGIPLNDSTCELCGQCISTCPTDALYDKQARTKGQCKDLRKVTTTCPYCGVGCQLDLNISPKNDRIVRVTSTVGCIPNDGNLCVKGKFGMDFVSSEKRLTTPLIKRNGKFEPASWDEALDLAASKLADIKSKHGPDSIAGLSSAKCTNEENYVFQKFIRAVIGTNNVDHCARLCHASTVAGLARAFGSGAMTNSIDELKKSDCIFIIGSNTTEAHPVLALSVKEAVLKNGAKLIVADPRTIDIVRFSQLHMTQKSGTDVALINAMMNVIINEDLHDTEFIAQRTECFEQIVDIVAEMTPQKASEITSVPADDIVAAARAFAKAETASIIYSMGITQHTTGTDNVLTLANLAMLTGNIGKESTGVNPLRGQNNVQGACDLGALPNVYPGYQSVEDPDIRQKFESAWQTELSGEKGLTAVEIFHAVEEKNIRAMYIMGENPALSDPNLNRTRKALGSMDFLIVQDIFLTETAAYADVVLPSVCFAEKDGTFTNTERRVQLVRNAVRAPGQARNDWQIVSQIAERMNYKMHYDSPAMIMDEIASLTPIYGGISHKRIDPVGIQWPCPDENHAGTKFLHKDKFARGKGKFHPVSFIPPNESPSKEFPFILSTGRQLYQYHTGTMTRKSPVIDQVSPTGYVEINSDDATVLNINNGDNVEVSTVRGVITTIAKVTDNIKKGTLFVPFHFSESPANILTNDALDPLAKIPEFKVCAAMIRTA